VSDSGECAIDINLRVRVRALDVHLSQRPSIVAGIAIRPVSVWRSIVGIVPEGSISVRAVAAIETYAYSSTPYAAGCRGWNHQHQASHNCC
jgi:hypothetical protein